jgi:hypothetical protein
VPLTSCDPYPCVRVLLYVCPHRRLFACASTLCAWVLRSLLFGCAQDIREM